ncbi:MAG: hypothetical protein NTY93_00910 [Candidatus Kaiserbacteria bacterium]|nr:hypothetical protein [Candidatus Kaiserbacteria bacterium]
MYNTPMNVSGNTSSSRQTAIHTLAVVGFVALIAAGLSLAVYATRFVPTVVNRTGAAAVYLGSFFIPSPGLSVVPTPTASSTLFFNEASSTVSTIATSTQPKKITATVGTKTTTSNITTNVPYGLPDLAVTITGIGYLATSSDDSFIASSTVPAGSRPAVRFTIKNIGTNWTGAWHFSASIPTQPARVYQSDLQQSLCRPGENNVCTNSIDYTLSFDRANTGANQTISITVNFDSATRDSNPNNNNTSAKITIL